METTCLFFLFTLYFIPAWLLKGRGSKKYSFQGSVLMSSGHDFYISFAVLLRAPSLEVSSHLN